MSYGLGLKALLRFVEDQDPYAYFLSKLEERLFKGENERQVFDFVNTHFRQFRALPKLETVQAQFPEISEYQAPEPSAYYLDKLEKRFGYDVINRANLRSQEILKADKDNLMDALTVLKTAVGEVTGQRHRKKLLDFGQEAPELMITTYQNMFGQENLAAEFGWSYMDHMAGGALPGDVISFVGRPATGKSWLSFRTGLHNFRVLHKNVLCVSMEMNTLQVAQRCSAMYAGTNVSQLKIAGYSDSTFKIWWGAMKKLPEEQGKFYVIDGNLAVNVEEIYMLADQLHCNVVVIDGAYLCRHPNPRLGRYERVAENVEIMKQASGDLMLPSFASWQFNREADKKKEKKQKVSLSDIGYTDVIGQVSTIVLGLMQEEGVETMHQRQIDVLKGRNGEVGQFAINWNFNVMDFDQVQKEQNKQEMMFL